MTCTLVRSMCRSWEGAGHDQYWCLNKYSGRLSVVVKRLDGRSSEVWGVQCVRTKGVHMSCNNEESTISCTGM